MVDTAALVRHLQWQDKTNCGRLPINEFLRSMYRFGLEPSKDMMAPYRQVNAIDFKSFVADHVLTRGYDKNSSYEYSTSDFYDNEEEDIEPPVQKSTVNLHCSRTLLSQFLERASAKDKTRIYRLINSINTYEEQKHHVGFPKVSKRSIRSQSRKK